MNLRATSNRLPAQFSRHQARTRDDAGATDHHGVDAADVVHFIDKVGKKGGRVLGHYEGGLQTPVRNRVEQVRVCPLGLVSPAASLIRRRRSVSNWATRHSERRGMAVRRLHMSQ